MKQSFIQVYTGNGKGKTTAAIGLAIRALGAGKKVLFLQFMKSKVYSEHNILPQFENLDLITVGKPFFIANEGMLSEEEKKQFGDEVVIFPKGQPPENYKKLIKEGFEIALEGVSGGKYDIVILDELNVALHFELLSFNEVETLLEAKSPHTEVIFTGRGAPQKLLDRADLVTNMEEVKHYYQQGVQARKGIES